MLQFSCRFAFLSTFRLSMSMSMSKNIYRRRRMSRVRIGGADSNRTPKITRILTLYQAQTRQLWRVANNCNFFKHTPKLIIFGTHDNLQTFKHNTLINELLLMQFYLFNIRPKLHHRNKWRKFRTLKSFKVSKFWTFSTSPAACWCCSSSNLYPGTLL